MNTRIKELVEQAGFGLGSFGFDSDPEMACGSVKDLEKFAELIVAECMTIAQEYDGAKLGGPGLIIAMRIEQHFGVEE